MTERAVEEREISGKRFVVAKIVPFKLVGLQFKIMNILGGGMGGISGFEMPSKDSDASEWVSLIGGVMGSTDPEKAQSLLMDIVALARVRIGDEMSSVDQITFNKIFESDLLASYKLAAFVLEVQFSDFLSPLKEAFSKMDKSETKQEKKSSGGLPQG